MEEHLFCLALGVARLMLGRHHVQACDSLKPRRIAQFMSARVHVGMRLNPCDINYFRMRICLAMLVVSVPP